MNSSDMNTQKVVDSVDIVEIVGRFVQLKRSGSGYKGFSPFKDEKTPSFSVNPDKKIFKDFSTGVGGNVIYFYSLMKKISYNEALIELAEEFNVHISINRSKVAKYSLQHRILEDAMRYYCDNLENSDIALNYLKNRNYTLDDIRKFKIGYSNNSWDGLLNSLGQKYEKNELLKLGLIARSSQNTERYYDVFRNRIMFPIFNKNMQVVAFGGRYIGNEENVPKYLNSSESEIFNKSNELYGIFDRGLKIKEKDYVILTEGYFDVIRTHINDFDVAVASLGTSFTENQAKLIKDLTKNVIIMYDNDQAGQNATRSAINILNKYEFNVKYVSLPEGVKDPDEFFSNRSENDFLELLKESIDAFEYIYGLESKNLDLSQISSKKIILEKMKPYFSNVTNSISYKAEISKLAMKLNIDKEDVLIEYANLKRKYRKKENKVVNTKAIYKEDDREKIERKTIEYLLYAKSEYRKKLKAFEFQNEVYKELNKKLSSLNYGEECILNLEFTEEEKKVLDEMAFETAIIGNKECIALYKSWINLYISEINYNDVSILVAVRLNGIKANMKTVEDIEILEKNFEEIKELTKI